MHVLELVQRLGGVARRAQLRALGVGDRELAGRLRAGDLIRVRRGEYALSGLDRQRLTAARLGGRITCGTLLREAGVWVGTPEGALHVALPRGANVVAPPGVTLHWHRGRPAADGGVGELIAALRSLPGCVGDDLAVASVDSALQLRRIRARDLDLLPKRLARRADGRCESGGESLVRLRLIALGIGFEPQAVIDGVGRVDFLIGDRLVLEVDGYGFHGSRAAFEADRSRDLELIARGLLVIRVSHRQVLRDWARIERSVLAIVRSRRHRRPDARRAVA